MARSTVPAPLVRDAATPGTVADVVKARTQRNPWRVVIVVAGLLLAANLLIWAGLATQQGDERAPLPGAIESTVPVEGGLTSSNSSVQVDLRDDMTGVLVIDGHEIPEDQITGTADLGVFEFRPGNDQELSRFEPGTHSATVVYWPRTGSRADAESFTWDFRVGG